jgi:hypothetical protein
MIRFIISFDELIGEQMSEKIIRYITTISGPWV